ncbi:MAG: hypothetical protein ACLQMU_12520 [Methanoregula sp.]|uniref:hypothetical protein n=1 Tax=Methanoregula sp. TaxID=2052170 RepID=UPI003FD752E4
MIDVKEAVALAFSEVERLYGKQAVDLLLEEMEMTEDENFWLITVGFSLLDTRGGKATGGRMSKTVAAALGMYQRKYKVFKIDRRNGKIISMKMRVA